MPKTGAEAPVEGVQWPKDDKGQRSSTAINKKIWVTAVAGRKPDVAEGIRGEKDWRNAYAPHLVKVAHAMAESPEACLDIAQGALDCATASFEFVRGDMTWPLKDAFSELTAPLFDTVEVKGSAAAPPAELRLPGGSDGAAPLAGADAVAQVERWRDEGLLEPDAAEAVRALSARPEWLDLRGQVFALIGATSELGPARDLLSMGATVLAVARQGPKLRALAAFAETTPGTILLPRLHAPSAAGAEPSPAAGAAAADACGADLLTHAPEIRTWISEVFTKKSSPSSRLVVGAYAYLDGEAHVRATVAADCVIQGLIRELDGGRVCIAQLCSPGTAHFVSKEAWEASRARADSAPWWAWPASLAFGRFVPAAAAPVRDASGRERFVIDGLAVFQGPNYALAKSLQHFRAVASRVPASGPGGALRCCASAHMAPAARTQSMLSSPAVAAALRGWGWFEPVRAFDARQAAALMSALLVRDVKDPASPANPDVQLPGGNPFELISAGAVHGGFWRCAWTADSIGKASYFLGLLCPS